MASSWKSADPTRALNALIAGEIDVAIVPELDGNPLQRALGVPGIRLMSVAQAEAIAKTVPGLKHVVLWRGLISLRRDIPDSDIDLLASRNRMLVRKDTPPRIAVFAAGSHAGSPLACRNIQSPRRISSGATQRFAPLSNGRGILPLGPDLLAALHVVLAYFTP